MARYTIRAHPHIALIEGKEVAVDSKQEAEFLKYLEEHGFSNRWIKPEVGGQRSGFRYTPDVELAVQENGMTHRAIIEVKPSLDFFEPYVRRRLKGVAKYYLSDVLYLFTMNDMSWHRIDSKTGKLSPSPIPTPGTLPVKRLHRAMSLPAPNVYAHRYRRFFVPVILKYFADRSVDLVRSPYKVPGRRRSRRRR